MRTKIGWGIVGTGAIARKFAADVAAVDGASLVAVCSRAPHSAEAFAVAFGVPRAYHRLADFAADDGIDVVYVATPQSRHCADTIALLRVGRAVLCEKPFALDADEARAMVEESRSAGCFLMEAMWSRFLPAHQRLDEILRSGVIGEPQVLAADFGYRVPTGSPHRLLDPSLGGGALLDLGVYPVMLATHLFGVPTSVAAVASIGETAVDHHTAAVLRFDSGAVAVLHASIGVRTPCAATISGTDGQIIVGPPFHAATALTVSTTNGVERIELPYTGHGLGYEVEEVVACLRDGRTESAVRPLDDTIAVMEVLDTIRSRAGLDRSLDTRSADVGPK